jgi:hypothetical protein
MTLNLSVVGRGVAIQVSDRHLSYAQTVRGRGSGLHDVYANKNVVFAPSYGLVSFGYTGLAYLERVQRTHGSRASSGWMTLDRG